MKPDQNASMVSWLCKIQFRKLETDVCWWLVGLGLSFFLFVFYLFWISLFKISKLWVFFEVLFYSGSFYPLPIFSSVAFLSLLTVVCSPPLHFLPRFRFPGISWFELILAVLCIKSFCFLLTLFQWVLFFILWFLLFMTSSMLLLTAY